MFDDYSAVVNAVKQRFNQNKILVVGDLILDRYLWGEMKRISPEAPVPIISFLHETETAGGAGNVALNLSGLGLEVSLVGIIGVDKPGESLTNIFQGCCIDTSTLIRTNERPTSTKTRIISGHQQILRIDTEVSSDIGEDLDTYLLNKAISELKCSSALILSDYAKGCLSKKVCYTLIDAAKRLKLPIFVDSKSDDYEKFRGVTGITPNLTELVIATGAINETTKQVFEKAEKMRQQLKIDFILITQGEDGMSLINENGLSHYSAVAKQVYDVTGAGDTVSSVVTVGLLFGLQLPDVLRLANVAASIVIDKLGTTPINREELLDELYRHEPGYRYEHKIYGISSLLNTIDKWRDSGETIVFTNGCFDLLHVGHITCLEAARRCGDRLVIGLNSDISVRALKGQSRPIVTESDRAQVLSALSAVDAIIIFDELTPLNIILLVKPDVLVKGEDYRMDEIVGADAVGSWGGEVVRTPVTPGKSTSLILRKVFE